MAEDQKQQFFVLVIHHKFGVVAPIFESHAAASRAVLQWADYWWALEVGEKPKPTDPTELVEAYFAAMEGVEFYEIIPSEVTSEGDDWYL